MDGVELLKSWPSWRNANAARVLASPAWRLAVRYRGECGELRISPVEADEAIWLNVKFEAEEHALGILNSEAYPDLHAIWTLRDRLPGEVLLALVEKECGGVFQMVEDAFRRQFAIVGLAEKAPKGRISRFDLALPGSGDATLSFLLNLSTAMEIDLGRFENLDVQHESIRALTREVEIRYASCVLSPSEVAALQPGDHLVLGDDAAPAWMLNAVEDDGVGIVAETCGTLSFAQLADDDLPPPPESEGFRVVQRGRTLAHARLGRLGEARVVTLDSLAST